MIDTLKVVGFHPYPSVFEARTLACTGLNFCKFAVSETKDLAIDVVKYLNERFSDFDEPVSISINGCPNSCAHPHIVDLGFVGAIVKRDDERHKGFDLIVGGHLEGEASRFAVKTGVKVTSDEVAPLIESLIREFESSNSQNFGHFLLEKYDHESIVSSTA
jgi:sulfite reductase (ferredoxin)